MKIAIISPSKQTEKAISKISYDLVQELKEQGVSAEVLPYTAGSPRSFLNALKKTKDHQVIHLHHEYNLLGYYGIPFFFFLNRFWFKDKKIIITMHTVLSKKEKFDEGKLKTFFRKTLYTTQNFLIKKLSNTIIVNENFFKEILIKDYKINSKKIKIIPQGVLKASLINKEKAKKELEIKAKNVFLIIGSLNYDNGADIVLKQADKIGKLILFVTNPEGANLRNKEKIREYIELNKKIVEKNKFHDYVRFDLKEISEELWWKYFSVADIVLQAYRGGIRSGVFSDAMASKVPVIASDIPFFREMSKKYKCLKIAKKDSDYSKLIKEALKKTEYTKMKKECERYIKDNSLNNIAKMHKKVYLE